MKFLRPAPGDAWLGGLLARGVDCEVELDVGVATFSVMVFFGTSGSSSLPEAAGSSLLRPLLASNHAISASSSRIA